MASYLVVPLWKPEYHKSLLAHVRAPRHDCFLRNACLCHTPHLPWGAQSFPHVPLVLLYPQVAALFGLRDGSHIVSNWQCSRGWL